MPFHKIFPITIIIAIFCATLLISCGRGSTFEDKNQIAIDNINKIAQGLDAYWDKFGAYPEDINVLKTEGFLTRFPFNPYQKEGTQMMQVPVATPLPGDFSYLKIYRGRFSNEIMYYVLILWGPKGTKGEDIFDNAYDYDNTHLTNWENMPDGTPDPYLVIIKSQLRLMPEGEGEE